jgi:hypothetical protein
MAGLEGYGEIEFQHQYTYAEIPKGKYSRMVPVDVIQNKDDIWIVEHKTGHLIFGYNRFKEADKEAFGEYEDLLVEILSRKNKFRITPLLLQNGTRRRCIHRLTFHNAAQQSGYQCYHI